MLFCTIVIVKLLKIYPNDAYWVLTEITFISLSLSNKDLFFEVIVQLKVTMVRGINTFLIVFLINIIEMIKQFAAKNVSFQNDNFDEREG